MVRRHRAASPGDLDLGSDLHGPGIHSIRGADLYLLSRSSPRHTWGGVWRLVPGAHNPAGSALRYWSAAFRRKIPLKSYYQKLKHQSFRDDYAARNK